MGGPLGGPPPTSGFPGDVVWSCLKSRVLPESVKGRERMRRGYAALSPTWGMGIGHGHGGRACSLPLLAAQGTPAEPLCVQPIASFGPACPLAVLDRRQSWLWGPHRSDRLPPAVPSAHAPPTPPPRPSTPTTPPHPGPLVLHTEGVHRKVEPRIIAPEGS